jgi:hypothetical protein
VVYLGPEAGLAACDDEGRPTTAAIAKPLRRTRGVIDTVEALAPSRFGDIDTVLPRAE